MKLKEIATLLTLTATMLGCVYRVDAVNGSPSVTPASWMIERWDGNDRLYQQMRVDIDRAISSGQNIDSLAQRYQANAKQNPYDPKTEYPLAYTAYKLAVKSNPLDENKLILARDALIRATPPHAYDYTRLRFLIEATLFVGPQYGNFRDAGYRLLRQKPDDAEVKYQLVRILGDSPKLVDQNVAVAYGESLVRKHPGQANYHANLAGAYLSRWLLFKNRTDADRSIDEFQRYLQIAPPSASFRPDAERMIKTIHSHE